MCLKVQLIGVIDCAYDLVEHDTFIVIVRE